MLPDDAYSLDIIGDLQTHRGRRKVDRASCSINCYRLHPIAEASKRGREREGRRRRIERQGPHDDESIIAV